MPEFREIHQRQRLARPDDHDVPSLLPQGGVVLVIAIDVLCDLVEPEFAVGGRELASLAGVAVPEAPVDEHDGVVLRQDYVWSSGKISPVESKPKTETVQQRPNQDLRPRIPVLDSRHNLASLLLGKDIHLDL